MAALTADAKTEMTRASIELEDRLIVALDVPTVENAKRLIEILGGAVNFYKIGLQLHFAGGLDLAKELVQQGKKVFLDAKLLDIDQTVTGAVQNVVKMGVTFLTVHGNGPTIRAAIEGRGKSSALKILAVTALTSLNADDLAELGVSMSVEQYVMMRVEKALQAGADGVIASGQEARKIRERAGNQLLIVTPGIRSEGVPVDDQKRVATPLQAIGAGADYLVMGREILRAPNPGKKAEEILRQIELGLKA
jgi:orotidine-5'-phosphate decarboxylase